MKETHFQRDWSISSCQRKKEREMSSKILLFLAIVCLGNMKLSADSHVDNMPVRMTYIDYDDPSVAVGQADTIIAGYNKAASVGSSIGFYSTAWGINKIGILQLDVAAVPGLVQTATLKAKVSGSTDSRRTTSWGVALTDNTWSADLTYNTAGTWTVSALLNGGTQVSSTQKSPTEFKEVEFDVSDAFSDGQTTATVLVYETAAGGGYMTEPILEVTYKPFYSTSSRYDFDDNINPFVDASRVSSAIESDAILNSKVLGWTCASNAQNGYSFSYFDFSDKLNQPTVVGLEFDYYNTYGGRSFLTIGDASVRGTTGGSTRNTYNPTGAIFRIGSDRYNAYINGTQRPMVDVSGGDTITNYGLCDRWLHIRLLINEDKRQLVYFIQDQSQRYIYYMGLESFYSSDANKCTQIDVFGYINGSHCAMIDNLKFFCYTKKTKQTLSLTEIPALTYGDTYALPTTTNEGQTLTWTVDAPTVASISNGTLTTLQAGTATVTATQAGNDEYAVFSQTFTLSVEKAPLTITANNASKVYSAANPSLTASYSGFVNGDNSSVLTTQPTLSTTATASSPAGTYPISVSGASATSYDITYVAGTLTITKASQSMTLSSIPEQTYGAEAYTLPTTTAQGQTLNWTVDNTDIATVSNGQLIVKKAGSTKVTATQTGGTNYEAFNKEFTLTVNKAALTVTANDATKTYGAANPTFTAAYDGFVNGDDATNLTSLPTISTTATTSSAVGTYQITIGGAASDNYNFTYKTGTLTVNKATLTITANNASKTYGSANPTLTVSYSGFVNGDNASKLTTQPTITTTATASSAVGTYAITASGAASANYTFSYKAGALTVTKAALTITANDKTMNVGDEIPALTLTYTGFVNGDNVSSLTTLPTVTTTATRESPEGTYPIIVSGAASGNYDITYVSGTLTVKDTFAQNNVIANTDIEARYGQKVTLPVTMTNDADLNIVGISFTLSLPQGVTIDVDEDGNPVYELVGGRLSPKQFSVYTNQYADGSWGFRIITNNATAKLNGTDGEMMNITLRVADTMVPGAYNILFTENKLSLRTEGNNVITKTINDVTSTLTVLDIEMGDVNGDGTVDLSDAIMVTYYSLHIAPASFIEAAADMNGDGDIDLSDAIIIIYKSLGVVQSRGERTIDPD